MQRSSCLRRAVLAACGVAAASLPARGATAVRATRCDMLHAQRLPACHLVCAARFHADTEAHDESAPRSGQYLLDKNDVLTRVMEVVKNFEKVDASKVTPESHFVNDLGLNSLDVVEVVFAIEQEFILDIPDHDAEKIQSIPDAVEYVAQNPMAK